MSNQVPGRSGSRAARLLAWFTTSRWSRIDGLVILGLGWLMGSDHRIGSRIALLVVVMFGVSFVNEVVLLVAARIAGRRTPKSPPRTSGGAS